MARRIQWICDCCFIEKFCPSHQYRDDDLPAGWVGFSWVAAIQIPVEQDAALAEFNQSIIDARLPPELERIQRAAFVIGKKPNTREARGNLTICPDCFLKGGVVANLVRANVEVAREGE